MKLRTCAVALIALLSAFLLIGCSAKSIDASLDVVEDVMEQHLDAVENRVEQAIDQTIVPKAPSPAGNPTLSREEAQAIALTHADLTAEAVSRLHTEFDLDDRIPHYDVQFDHGLWEYEYEIHAETGDILSYDRDD